MKPFVSVVIPVFNDDARLKLCLQALENQSYDAQCYEVWVVNNEAQRDISPLVQLFAHAKTLHETRRGSYAARNLGIEHARGEIIAFTDSDCIPARDWIEKGVARLLSSPDCGLVAGEIEVFCRTGRRPNAIERYEMLEAFSQRQWVEKHGFGATANVFTWRRVLDEIGVFDGSLQSGGDMQWGNRVAAAYPLIFAEEVRIRHPARCTWRALRDRTMRTSNGYFDINRAGKTYSRRNLSQDLKNLRSPFRLVAQIRRDSRLYGARQKIEYGCVCAAVKQVRFAQLLQRTVKNLFRPSRHD